ncbi:hypothetical protein BJX64DRAFT_263257 [Aspergillus heterothallicus]
MAQNGTKKESSVTLHASCTKGGNKICGNLGNCIIVLCCWHVAVDEWHGLLALSFALQKIEKSSGLGDNLYA